MGSERQRELVSVVTTIIHDLDPTDAVELVALVQGSSMLKAKVTQEMVTFFANNMNTQIQ